MISQSACVTIGGFAFPLGIVYGQTSQDMCDELANRLEMLAETLRGGPNATITEITHWQPPVSDEVAADQREVAAWFQQATEPARLKPSEAGE